MPPTSCPPGSPRGGKFNESPACPLRRSFANSTTLASISSLFFLLSSLHEFFRQLEDGRHVCVLGIGNIEISFAVDHPVYRHETLFRDIDAPRVRRIFAVKIVMFLQG